MAIHTPGRKIGIIASEATISDAKRHPNSEPKAWLEGPPCSSLYCYEGSIENLEPLIAKPLIAKLELVEPEPRLFTDGVIRVQDYIREGDVYQVNLSRKYIIKHSLTSLDELRGLAAHVHQRLLKSNPARYSTLAESASYIIISSSPECFLRIEKIADGFKLSTMPIKGTAKLGDTTTLRSTKNQAEHIMIVDLERSDLGRIAKPRSVEVEDLMRAEKFNNLEHLVSTVACELDHKYILADGNPDLNEIFKAIFPSGSITGAPKIRCMEIIRELEPCLRGPYTGVLGSYQNGYGEYSILIRTIVIDKRSAEISFHVGGGITSLSDPLEELAETRLKADKIIEAIGC